MSEKENNIISRIYQQIRQIKITPKKNILLLKNRADGQYSVAKRQIRQQQTSSIQRTVRHEGKFFLQMQGHIGIPIMRWVGKDGIYDILILQKLGQTLQELLKKCGECFSLKTITLLGIKMIQIIQNYHQKGFIHRNLTPKDFQMGLSQKNTKLYLNDLMDSQTYINKKINRHIQHRSNCRVTNLNIFMNVDQLKGNQQSRKNDIEAILNILIYFSLGKLPWQSIMQQNISQQGKIKKMIKKILETPVQMLCHKLPKQFISMLINCRNMKFQEQPNYHFYYQQLHKVMYHHHIKDDEIYDWVIKANPQNKLSVQQKRLKLLKVQPHLKTDLMQNEYQILKNIYFPYEKEIEVDQITVKYDQQIKKKAICNSYLYQDEQNVSNHIKVKKGEKETCQIY